MIDRNGQSFDRSGGRSDPMTQFFVSVADAWGRGLQAWRLLAGFGTSSQSDRAGTTLSAMIDQTESVAKSFEPFMSFGSGSGNATEASRAAMAQVADILPAVAEAYMVGASSAIRYWSTLADLGVRYEAGLVQAAADRVTGQNVASPAECRVLADELRAFLREIGDAATREARRLQLDLERVGETIAQAADQATPPPHPFLHRRRHEVKP
jgi:hypothetical protein